MAQNQQNNPNLPTLQQALAMFVEGAQAQGLSNALSSANEQVRAIKSAGMAEAQQRQALQDIANRLVMDMTARGANASQIEQIYNATISKRPQVQTAEQAILMGDEEQQRLGQTMRKEDNAIKARMQEAVEERALRLMGAKDELANRKLMTTEMRKSQSAYQKSVKDLDKAAGQARNAIKLLSTTDGAAKVSIGAVQTMLAKASGEVGNLTEMERAAFSGRQDVISRLRRYAAKTLYSELPEEDREALKEIAQIYSNSTDDLKAETGRLLADQYTSVFQVDPNEALEKVTGGRIKPVPRPEGPAAQGAQAPAAGLSNFIRWK